MLLSSTVDGGSDPNLVNSMENQGGLQHSLSQDPMTNSGNQILGYSSGSDRGYTSDSELEVKSQNSSSQTRLSSLSPAQSWILLTHNTIDDTGNGSTTTTVSSPSIGQQQLQQQSPQQISFTPDPKALLKSCETLSFLVRDAAHITPDNFTLCVGAIRSFVEACSARLANKNNAKDSVTRKLKWGKRYHSPEHGGGGLSSGIPKSQTFPSSTNNSSAYDADYESDLEADQIAASHQCSIQLLDLLHTLHTRASQIFQWWQKENMQQATAESLWTLGWKPLLQTIGILCCDGRKQVRTTALTYLQRALLVDDLQQLAPPEWYSCFDEVLFPLMTRLLEPLNHLDPQGMEETRMRAATLLCKVFLQHLTPLLGLEGFNTLCLEILSVMERYMKCDQHKCELLMEAIPESLKNLLLVMDTAGIFHTPDCYTKLWVLTWEKIDSFLPNLRAEMFAAVQVSNSQGQVPPNNQNQVPPQHLAGSPTSAYPPPVSPPPPQQGMVGPPQQLQQLPVSMSPPPPQQLANSNILMSNSTNINSPGAETQSVAGAVGNSQVKSSPHHTEVILDA